jgi:hypothetical protein
MADETTHDPQKALRAALAAVRVTSTKILEFGESFKRLEHDVRNLAQGLLTVSELLERRFELEALSPEEKRAALTLIEGGKDDEPEPPEPPEDDPLEPWPLPSPLSDEELLEFERIYGWMPGADELLAIGELEEGTTLDEVEDRIQQLRSAVTLAGRLAHVSLGLSSHTLGMFTSALGQAVIHLSRARESLRDGFPERGAPIRAKHKELHDAFIAFATELSKRGSEPPAFERAYETLVSQVRTAKYTPPQELMIGPPELIDQVIQAIKEAREAGTLERLGLTEEQADKLLATHSRGGGERVFGDDERGESEPSDGVSVNPEES